CALRFTEKQEDFISRSQTKLQLISRWILYMKPSALMMEMPYLPASTGKILNRAHLCPVLKAGMPLLVCSPLFGQKIMGMMKRFSAMKKVTLLNLPVPIFFGKRTNSFLPFLCQKDARRE